MPNGQCASEHVLREVGVEAGATWALAEGGDAALLSRSIPLEKLMDDALFVYAMNGEPLRPAAGFPVRLFNPGWEGNTSVKWLRRLELIAQPNMSRDETQYTDPLPNESARQFSFVMDAKSTITYPTPGAATAPGWLEIRGLAWSGRGAHRRGRREHQMGPLGWRPRCRNRCWTSRHSLHATVGRGPATRPPC